MMSSEMAGLLSLGLVLDGWLFTCPLDKAFPSVFFGVCFWYLRFWYACIFCHSESLKVPLYFLVFSIPHFLQRNAIVLQHSKVCCFWCSGISFCPLLTQFFLLLFTYLAASR